MNTKLQALTETIYQEGVEKGKAEAAEIIAKAQAEATQIVEAAKKEAVKINNDATQAALALKNNTQSELKLYAAQALQALKTETTDVICGQIVSDAVKGATGDKDFMQKFLLKLVDGLVKESDLVIETNDAETLNAFFVANAKELLNKGVTIKEVKGIKCDFSIKSSKEGYKMAFGEEEFVAYFKQFLRPKLVEMLF